MNHHISQTENKFFAYWIFIFGLFKSNIEVRQDTPDFLTAHLGLMYIISLNIDWTLFAEGHQHHKMNKKFLPTSRNVLPTFETFCPVAVHFAQTIVHFPTFKIRPEKGVFWGGAFFVYVHIPKRSVWLLSKEHGLVVVFWAKWVPIWKKWDPSGQFVRKVGKSALELGNKKLIIS